MINELLRFPAPGAEPLGLAFDGPTLWISSREAHRLYALDLATHAVSAEIQTPGAPFGIAVAGNELRVVIGFGEDDDDRYIYRFVPGHGFKNDPLACPDLSGVHLAFDGETLFLSQAHNMRILALDDRGGVTRDIRLERRPLGMTIDEGVFSLITGNSNFEDLQLAKLDARTETTQITSLASIPFEARGLASDGVHLWTGHRDAGEIVAFAIPATVR